MIFLLENSSNISDPEKLLKSHLDFFNNYGSIKWDGLTDLDY
jgi:hypothetical protein